MNTVLLDLLITAGMFAAMVVCAELGRRFERWRAGKFPGRPVGATSIIEPSVLGLLALLLSFTFGWSAARLDYHRRLIAEEANAIGTAYLRLDILPPQAQPGLRDLFRRYLEARIGATAKLPRAWSFQPEPPESAALQQEIWAQAQAAVKIDRSWTAPAILLLPAINAMIDVTTKRRMEFYSHVPLLVLVLFAFVALVSAFLVGRTMAGQTLTSLLQVVAFAAAVAMTLFVVLDLEFPRAGLVRLDVAEQNALTQLRDVVK